MRIRIGNSFGLSDLDQVLKKYAPDLTGATLNTEKGVSQVSKNQVEINNNINVKHDELMEELRSLKLQNQELQEKYDALVERMAGFKV